MKRAILFGLILFCAAQVFSQQGGSAQNGVIKEISGTVELKRAGQSGFIPVKVGDIVALDTIVSTGFKSTARIEAGSTVITVRPLTRLSFSELSVAQDKETINVNLQCGKIRVDVKPSPGTATTIKSPVATASVRGTSFEFDTERLSVLEGIVAFIGSIGRVVLVSAGCSSEIKNGRAIYPVEAGTGNLLLPPLAGSDSKPGQVSASGSSASNGGISFTFVLK